MKKSLLLSTVPFLLFGFEVNFSKNFSTKLIPNELSSNVTVSIEKNKEVDAISSLEKYNKFIKNYDSIGKESGRVSVMPLYQYKDGQSNITGYKATITYKLFTQESNEMTNFLTKLYEKKSQESDSILISTLKWNIDSKTYEDKVNSLRLNVIKWALQYQKDLSLEINKRCSVKNISINESNRPQIYMGEMRSLKVQSASVPIPSENLETIEINPNIVLECR
ncbi:MAG: SIMPL domain-containing protein [Candidatus Marinarcus sp.]|uniref:SIMPL domain-containing protein n=1 Tax=Candidatus Marinarcus sp. TaxID=3100987 RepID=UPI003B0068E8